jgi:hypothetical protein
MNYTDEQLKQALAKMLPETVCYEQESLYWQYEEIRYDRPVMNRGNRILDTELLHLCWLAEKTLSPIQTELYEKIFRLKFLYLYVAIHVSWQQRVEALAKVKGIEI